MKRTKHIHRARDYYAQGYTLGQVAGLIGASINTIANWKKRDAGGEDDWDDLRQRSRQKDPIASLVGLEQARANLIARRGGMDEAKWAGALYKLDTVIERSRRRLNDPDTILNALALLANWCRSHPDAVNNADLDALGRCIEAFGEDLKRGEVAGGD